MDAHDPYPQTFHEAIRDIFADIDKLDDDLKDALERFYAEGSDPSSTRIPISTWVFVVVNMTKRDRDIALYKHLAKRSAAFDSRVAGALSEAPERQKSTIGDREAARMLEVHRMYRTELHDQDIKQFRELNAFRIKMGNEYKERLAMELKKQREAMESEFAARLQQQSSEVEDTTSR
ncbi:hypothetical protein DENSPDRAFT_881429 [Dentipellis sp. KUC8613]|nr:hypothetical protein DENSPDRAFT_881429 [Dentipellis sp. KUC8613]